MKKILLIAIATVVGMSTYAQGNFQKMSTKFEKRAIVDNVNDVSTNTNGTQLTEAQNYTNGDRSVTIMPIGSSSNVYSILGNGRTYVWADPNVNSVVFTHRMLNEADTYGNSRVAYDVSWEGGAADTWTSNIHVYDPLGPGGDYPDAAGRYPQGAIVNPAGNTNPDNAYYTYFIATLDNTNDNWGGYGYGSNVLTAVDPANPTQNNVGSSGDYLRLIPRALTVTQQGVSWMVDESYDAAADEYQGKLIMNKGTINGDGEIEYEEWTIDVLAAGDGINDIKVAFTPDGQTGYILVMCEEANNQVPYTNYHPVLFETTDGGDNWSTTPIHCQLGGTDGLAAVKEFVADEVLDDIYGAGWNRDEIVYNMGFHADLVVDAEGNAHVTGLVTCADDGGWYPTGDASATFHLIYNRTDEAWDGRFVFLNKTFDGDLGDVTMYNRPQIGTDKDGNYLFISWLDTDIEEETNNLNPDIYCVGYDVRKDEYTEIGIVTQFTEAMYSAYFGTMSHYTFSEVNGNETTCTIPFVYAHMDDPQDPIADIQYKYIDGWSYTFEYIGVNNNVEAIANVKQNYPNPVSGSTTIEVDLLKSANLSVEVTNLIGQTVYQENRGNVSQGMHKFEIDASSYSNGVYFYTVKTNNSLVTKKMIVE